MRWLLTTIVLGLAVSLALAQNGGLFDSVRNFFNRPRRQPQQFQPQQFQPQPPQQQFQPQFQPPQQNRFQPQQQQFRPQNQAFGQDQSFNPAPQNQGFNRGRPENNNNFNSQPSRPLNFRQCAVKEPASFCPPAEPNHFYNGKRYLLTWNISCSNCECAKFTGEEADDYCKGMGARAVSLDTPDKAEHFLGVSAQWAQRYYWTGGRMQYPDNILAWPSGRTEFISQRGSGYWSQTGGADDKGPQPDNRNFVQDNCEPEFCVGVLNNFYADGIKWHDVACHHKKPTICEWP